MSCYERVESGGKTSFSKDCSLWKVCIKWIQSPPDRVSTELAGSGCMAFECLGPNSLMGIVTSFLLEYYNQME